MVSSKNESIVIIELIDFTDFTFPSEADSTDSLFAEQAYQSKSAGKLGSYNSTDNLLY